MSIEFYAMAAICLVSVWALKRSQDREFAKDVEIERLRSRVSELRANTNINTNINWRHIGFALSVGFREGQEACLKNLDEYV